MKQNSIVMSFMVRCCQEPNGCLRVLIRRIANGEEHHFNSLEDGLDYIRRKMQESGDSTVP